MSGRPKVGRPESVKLRSFYLEEISEELRVSAAKVVCRRAADDLQRDRDVERPSSRAATPGERLQALDLSIEAVRKAMFPSSRVYRVSLEAWEKVVR